MSKEVDSGALTLLNRMLGLAGQGSAQTLLEDGTLNQTLDVAATVRRSRTIAGSDGGLFSFSMENEHGAGATDRVTNVDVYGTGGTAENGVPPIVPSDLEWFLLYAGLITTGGTSSLFTEGVASLLFTPGMIGFSRQSSGGAASNANLDIPIPLGRWDLLSTADGSSGVGVQEDGAVMQRIGIRIRRGSSIRFNSAAGGVVDVALVGVAALVPIVLGQDGIS